jgi:hypothetical protein
VNTRDKNLGSKKCWKFLDSLHNCQAVKKDHCMELGSPTGNYYVSHIAFSRL